VWRQLLTRRSRALAHGFRRPPPSPLFPGQCWPDPGSPPWAPTRSHRPLSYCLRRPPPLRTPPSSAAWRPFHRIANARRVLFPCQFAPTVPITHHLTSLPSHSQSPHGNSEWFASFSMPLLGALCKRFAVRTHLSPRPPVRRARLRRSLRGFSRSPTRPRFLSAPTVHYRTSFSPSVPPLLRRFLRFLRPSVLSIFPDDCAAVHPSFPPFGILAFVRPTLGLPPHVRAYPHPPTRYVPSPYTCVVYISSAPAALCVL
jgi:hypothetical protein